MLCVGREGDILPIIPLALALALTITLTLTRPAKLQYLLEGFTSAQSRRRATGEERAEESDILGLPFFENVKPILLFSL